jgi:hypothetical protein
LETTSRIFRNNIIYKIGDLGINITNYSETNMMLCRNISWCCFQDLLSYIWSCVRIFRDVASKISYLIYDVVSEYFVMLFPRSPILYMMLFRNIHIYDSRSWKQHHEIFRNNIIYKIGDLGSNITKYSETTYSWCCFQDLLFYIWCCVGIFRDVASEICYLIYDDVSEYFVMLPPRSAILYMMCQNISWYCFRDLLSYIWCCVEATSRNIPKQHHIYDRRSRKQHHEIFRNNIIYKIGDLGSNITKYSETTSYIR